MSTHKLVARVDTEDDGSTPARRPTFLVRSPAVGVVDGRPDRGVYLNPMRGFLTLTVLNRRHVVLLPRKVEGRVVETFIDDTYTPVGFNQPLFRLSQVAMDATREAGAAAAGAGGRAELDADLIAVQAPSEGVFYRRPGPDSPPYVEEGSEVSSGSVLGLVEVMKSFNQISYGGPGLPERGRVERVLAEDSAEVSFGQTLFLIRPE
jgi:acetyl-CoA carboxylase biotin carboxyl carrier protein